MHIYVIGTVLAVLFAKFAMNVKPYPSLKKSYYIWAVLSFLPLFLISALRYDVGTDYLYVYDPFFHAINAGENEFSEIGFNLINRITYLIVDDSALMFAVVAFLTLLFTFLAYYQQSVNVSYSILIFVISTIYFNSMNQIRQNLAMAIFLYAMKYIRRREPIKYYLWILLAFSMHTSSVLFVPLYFVYNLKVNVKAHFILMLGVFATLPFMQVLIRVLISLTPYAWYLNSMYSTSGFSYVQFAYTLMLLVMLYFCYLNSKDTEDKDYNFMLYMHLFALIFVTYSAVIPQSNRLMISMTVIQPLIVPKALLRIEEKNRRIVVFVIFLMLFGFKVFHDICIQGWYDVLPYQTIFSR